MLDTVKNHFVDVNVTLKGTRRVGVFPLEIFLQRRLQQFTQNHVDSVDFIDAGIWLEFQLKIALYAGNLKVQIEISAVNMGFMTARMCILNLTVLIFN